MLKDLFQFTAKQEFRIRNGAIKVGKLFGIACFLFVFLFAAHSVMTATGPSIITYQGKLLESGSSVTTTKAMKFVIYDASTEGSAVYTAAGTLPTTSTINVSPTNGIFSVDLGGTGTNSLSESVFNANELWLEVTVSGTTLSPRKRLTSVPFAVNSARLNGVAATSTASTSTYIPISDSDGSFSFNTTTVSQLFGTSVSTTNLTVSSSATLATTTINGTLTIGGDVSGLTSSDLSDSSDLAYLGNTQTFTGVNTYNATSTFAATVQTQTGNFESTVSETATNLLSNPSFESGISTSWTSTGGSSVSATTTAYDGSTALQIDYTTNLYTTTQNVTSLTAGSSYTVSFYARGASGGESVRVMLTDTSICGANNGIYNFSTEVWDCIAGSPDTSLGSNVVYTGALTTSFARTSLTLAASSTGFSVGFLHGADATYDGETVIVDAVQLEAGTSATTFDDGTGSVTAYYVLDATDAYNSWAESKRLLTLRTNSGNREYFSVRGDGAIIGGSASTSAALKLFGTTNTTTPSITLDGGTNTFSIGGSGITTDSDSAVSFYTSTGLETFNFGAGSARLTLGGISNGGILKVVNNSGSDDDALQITSESFTLGTAIGTNSYTFDLNTTTFKGGPFWFGSATTTYSLSQLQSSFSYDTATAPTIGILDGGGLFVEHDINAYGTIYGTALSAPSITLNGSARTAWPWNNTNSGYLYPSNSSDIVVVGATATSTATSVFEVTGTSTLLGNVFMGSASEAITTSTFTLNGDDAYVHDLLGVGDSLYVENDVYIGTSTLRLNGDSSGGQITMTNGPLTLDSSGQLNINTTNNSSVIFGSGNVGINTTTASYLVDIFGSASAGTAEDVFSLRVADGGVGQFLISNASSSNNVFIPEIYGKSTGAGSNALVIRGQSEQASGSAVIQFMADFAGDGMPFGTGRDLFNFFDGSSSEIFSITTAGVDVTGGLTASATSTLGGLTTSGNVGIGTTTPSYGLTVAGTSYFANTSTFRGKAIHIGNAETPVAIKRVATQDRDVASTGPFAISGNYAFGFAREGSDIKEQLIVFDISNPQNPTIINTTTLGSYGFPTLFEVQGNTGYAISGNSIYAIDLSVPSYPRFYTSSTLDGITLETYSEMEIAGDYLIYSQALNKRFVVMNISNPESIRLNSVFYTSNTIYSFDVNNDKIYAMDGNTGFHVIDIADVNSTSTIGRTSNLGGGYLGGLNMKMRGHIAAVFSPANNSVSLVDLSDPTNFRLLGSVTSTNGITLNLDGDTSAVFANDYLYVEGTSGLYVLNISDLTDPRVVGVYVDTLDDAEGRIDIGDNILMQGQNIFTFEAEISLTLPTSTWGAGLNIIDVGSGQTANTEIGSALIDQLQVRSASVFNNDVSIAGGLEVGSGGLLVSGDVGFRLATGTQSSVHEQQLSFSHKTRFKSYKTNNGDNENVFIFDTYWDFNSSTDYILSVRNQTSPVFSVAGNGDVHADGTLYAQSATIGTPGAPGDLAERIDIRADQTVEPGDVLVVDNSDVDMYRKSDQAYASAVAGVVSTKPTIVVGDARTKNNAVMAMIGRVPIKVSGENGPIQRGDLLVTASIPGYAMRYDPSIDTGNATVAVVGLALDSFTSSTGSIMGLVQSGWINNRNHSIAELQQDLLTLATAEGIDVQTNLTRLSVGETQSGRIIDTAQKNLNLNGYFILNVGSIVGADEQWEIDTYGRFVTRVQTEDGRKKNLYALQSEQSEVILSGSSQLEDGKKRIDFTTDVTSILDSDAPVKVSVTLTDDAAGIFVTEKSIEGFVVQEVGDGSSNATFDWVVIAERKLNKVGDRAVAGRQVEMPVTDTISREPSRSVPNSNPVQIVEEHNNSDSHTPTLTEEVAHDRETETVVEDTVSDNTAELPTTTVESADETESIPDQVISNEGEVQEAESISENEEISLNDSTVDTSAPTEVSSGSPPIESSEISTNDTAADTTDQTQSASNPESIEVEPVSAVDTAPLPPPDPTPPAAPTEE